VTQTGATTEAAKHDPADPARPARDPGIPVVSRRRAAIAVLLALVLGLGALAVVGRLADYGRVGSALSGANRWWLLLCLVGVIAAYAGYIAAYRDVARAEGGPALDLWTVTRVVVVGFGATVVGSSAGGLAVDLWALHRAGASADEATCRVLALNTLEWLVLGLLAMVAGTVVLAGGGGGAERSMSIAWLTVVPVCIALGWWVARGARGRRLSTRPGHSPPFQRHPGSWPAWGWATAHRGFAAAIGGLILLGEILRRPRRYPGAVLGYPLYWGGDILCLGAAVIAVGGHPGLAPLVLAYASGYVASAIPLPAGGAGGIEAALALTLHAVGVPLAVAVAGVLVFRAFTFWLPLLPALIMAPSIRGLYQELPGTPRAAG
jgi:uncharacterized membrane protein YbhN (UPF0104 family)